MRSSSPIYSRNFTQLVAAFEAERLRLWRAERYRARPGTWTARAKYGKFRGTMQTPRVISLQEFAARRKEWIAEHCVTDGEFQNCRTCGGRVEIVRAYMSLHDPRFPGCVGGGKVLRLVIPYCPRCEACPDEYGCIHDGELAVAAWGSQN
jgi:hypothetical protein